MRDIKFKKISDRRWRKKNVRAHRISKKNLDIIEYTENRKLITCPTRISLSTCDDHERLCAFLESLRAAYLKEENITIDFRRLEKCDSAGTLLFSSELHRLHLIGNKKLNWKCLPSKRPRENEVLFHLKIFQLLHHKKSYPSTRSDVVSWRSASSNEPDGEQFGPIIETFSKQQSAHKTAFRIVSEAVNNSVEHAYYEDRNDGISIDNVKMWWAFARLTDGFFHICVCDLGIGIPRSLQKRWGEKVISMFPNQMTDAKMISAALELSRTRTEKTYRGKGLSDYRKVFDLNNESALTIFSNKGRCTLKINDQKTQDYKKINLRHNRNLEDKVMSIINIGKSFTRYPVGRDLGPFNGKKFRLDVLIPALNRDDKIEIELDDALGYGSSFLDEAFGGLIRSGFKVDDVRNRIKLVSEDSSLIDEIWSYVNAAG